MKICKIFVFVIGASLLTRSACSQVISLKTCIDAFEKDSSFFRKLPVKSFLPMDTVMVKDSLYAMAFKGRKSKDVSILKSFAPSTPMNKLIYSFENLEQYDLFSKELAEKPFVLAMAREDTTEGVIVSMKIYLRGNMVLNLTKIASSVYKSMFFGISTPTKEEIEALIKKAQ